MNNKQTIKTIHTKGFTLVELLISVGIIMMVTLFTLPGFNEFTKRKNFERAVESFAVGVQNTRAKAIAGARHPDNTIPVEDGDLWGIIIYCSPNVSVGESGLFYQVYTRSTGRLSDFTNSRNYTDSSNLNLNHGVSGSKLKYRFQCTTPPYSPGYGNQYIFFDKFTGLGNASAEKSDFASSDSITVTIVDDSLGLSKNVVIYKTGIVDVQ